MLGAITGDIVGSIYERSPIKTKIFPLFDDGCRFTDDSVLTVATAVAIMNGGQTQDFIDSYRKYGNMYPNAGYGGKFMAWLDSDEPLAYNSFGNGSAMRVSPCGWIGETVEETRSIAEISAKVTHDHPEGVKGAQAIAEAIFYARLGKKTDFIKKNIMTRYGYNLDRTLDDIRPDYRFELSCQKTVPEAIIAFMESTGYEDCIRNAVSLGGDSDTLAAISGSIAEAAFGIPEHIKEKTFEYLDTPLISAYQQWLGFLDNRKRRL